MKSATAILADARWIGPHGIGRFAANVLSRLPAHSQLRSGPRHLSFVDPIWLSYQIARHRPEVFFSPGFSLPAVSLAPLVFTIYDLIPIQLPTDSLSSTCTRKLYFHTIVKRAARRAYRVLTVSEHSRSELLQWTGLHSDAIVNVGAGVDRMFQPTGKRHEPGFDYILYVGNFKPHKNIDRLLEAFAKLPDPAIHLLLTGCGPPRLLGLVKSLGLDRRVQFTGCVDDLRLAELYRGAILVVLPSLREGFGLPPLEAMACGTPVVVSRAAALPEVVGDAGVFVDPLDIADIRRGLERALTDSDLRRKLIAAGRLRAAMFRWEDVARRVADVLGVTCPEYASAAVSQS